MDAAATINGADTAWLLISTALVMLMTPGLAFFYGGLVNTKNVLSTSMHSFIALGIITLEWVVVGYSMAFGPTHGGWIGGMDFMFLKGVGMGAEGPYGASTIPHLLFMAFQMMFAIITPALISGAIAERMKFSAYVVFILAWALLVYNPICHWVWGPGGWLGARGALDFAGGTVVHLSSGAAALVCALVLGKRTRTTPPHNLMFSLLGAGLLWFGWFGFNAGSAVAANGTAALALVNTQIAAGVAALTWAIVDWIKLGKPTGLGVATGLVAGLVVITPAAGFISPMSSVILGIAAGTVCYGAVLLKSKLGYDDALDAFGVHGVGGATGAILTGVFAAEAWGGAGKQGLLDGSMKLFTENLIGVGVAAAYSFIVTFIILKVIDLVIGLRVSESEESEGLDTTLHGEEAYHSASSAS